MEYINGKQQIPRESTNFFTTYKYNLEQIDTYLFSNMLARHATDR